MTGALDLIPHQPPWRLVDRVVATTADSVRAEKRLGADDPLLCDGLPELLALEALAQTAACLMAGSRGAHVGYLVAVRGFEFPARAQAGDTLELWAQKTAALGDLHRFTGEARAGGRLVARGEMTFALKRETS